MARRTKEELRAARANKRIDELISSVKWLRDTKFHKTNFWSMAHFQSWAVNGKDGSCGCGCGYYSGSLCNTRRNTRKGGIKEHCKHVLEKLCYDCIKSIESKLSVSFKRDYAP